MELHLPKLYGKGPWIKYYKVLLGSNALMTYYWCIYCGTPQQFRKKKLCPDRRVSTRAQTSRSVTFLNTV